MSHTFTPLTPTEAEIFRKNIVEGLPTTATRFIEGFVERTILKATSTHPAFYTEQTYFTAAEIIQGCLAEYFNDDARAAAIVEKSLEEIADAAPLAVVSLFAVKNDF